MTGRRRSFTAFVITAVGLTVALPAAQNTADVGSLEMIAAISACDLNAVSPSTPA